MKNVFTLLLVLVSFVVCGQSVGQGFTPAQGEKGSTGRHNPLTPSVISTDGFGASLGAVSFDRLEFEEITLPVGGNIVGESFLGATATEKYLFAAPQDADALIRYDLISGDFDTLQIQYENVETPGRTRDKFNGIVYDGEYIYVVPSWSAPLLKIDPDSLEIVEEYGIFNDHGDDAFNGAVVVNNEDKIFAVPHNSSRLKWLDKSNNSIGSTDLSEISGISQGSRSFLSGCYDGKSLWLYPRASTKMLEVNPKTGAVIGEYVHPAAAGGAEPIGYFHGGSFDGRYIWLTPFNTDLLVWFDTVEKEFFSAAHGLPNVPNGSNDQYSLGSVFVDGMIYFIPFRATKSLVVNTIDQTFQSADTNLSTPSGGSAVYTNGKVYFFSAHSPTLYVANVAKDISVINSVISEEITVHGGVEVITAGLPIVYDGISEKLEGSENIVPFNGAGFTFESLEKISVSPRSLDLSGGGTIVLEFSGAANAETFPRVASNASSFSNTDGFSFFLNENANDFVLAVGTTSLVGTVNAGNGSTVRRAGVSFDATGAFMSFNGSGAGSNTNNYSFPSGGNDIVIGNFFYGGSARPFDRNMIKIAVYDTRLTNAELNTLTTLSTTDFSTAKLYIDFSQVVEERNEVKGLRLLGGVIDQDSLPGQAGDILTRNLSGGVSYTSSPRSTNVNLGGNRIINVDDPINSSDAATRGYVDNATRYIIEGSVHPEGNVAADVGTIFINILGNGDSILYLKENNDIATQGWQPLLDREDEPAEAYVTDVIWAEESGALTSNNLGQYSFGNGATGGVNYGLPIWEDMTAVGMIVNAEITGTSVVIQYAINGTTQPLNVTATGNTTVSYFSTEANLSSGDLLNFRTGLEVGAWTDVRVGLIVKKTVKYD